MKPVSLLSSAVGVLLVLTPASALADPSMPETGDSVAVATTAIASEGAEAASAAAPSDLTLNGQAGDGITVQAPAGDITLRLPASGAAMSDGVTNVFEGAGPESNVLTQPVAEGARALVEIAGPGAPTEYSFPIEGASLLEQLPDGSVLVHDGNGEPSVTIAAPWARDANGDSVPTSYSVDGTVLVQHIAHEGAAYPVIVDPTVKQTIKRVISDCLKGALGGATVAGIISSIDSVSGAVKFVVRRIGFFAAVGCAGGIVYRYI